jgi:hypothetical protein
VAWRQWSFRAGLPGSQADLNHRFAQNRLILWARIATGFPAFVEDQLVFMLDEDERFRAGGLFDSLSVLRAFRIHQ